MSDTKMNVKEFELGSVHANLAEIKLSGRYPEKGMVANTNSEMTVYIIKGSVVFLTETGHETFNEGAALVVPIGKKYAWQPIPDATILIFSCPPWTPEQQESFPNDHQKHS